MNVQNLNEKQKNALILFLQQLGDNHLILGHRLSEWCGHGPILEEDIALTNLALDHIGQANAFLELAGKIEGKGRDADKLAFFREAVDFQNHQLVERPNEDFAFTMVREYFFALYCDLFYKKLIQWDFKELNDILQKAVVENAYHLQHAKSWIVRLGDGTEESHHKMQKAINELYPYALDLYSLDDHKCAAMDLVLIKELKMPNREELLPQMKQLSIEVLSQAMLQLPDVPTETYKFKAPYSYHSEELGYILAEMQIVARSYPNASW